MLKFLHGDKSASSIERCAPFLTSLGGYLKGTNLAIFDLETGSDAKRGKRYAVSIGDEAVNPHSAEVLLAGVMPSAIKNYKLGSDDNNERGVLKFIIDKLDDVHSSGGAISGHNILAFDLPMLVSRARLMKVPRPNWLSSVCSMENRGRSLDTKVFDTYRFFAPFSRFQTSSMSLGDLSRFWGRSLAGHGPAFGDIWHSGNTSDRAMLKLYNLWDLLDSISLSVFTGIADTTRTGDGAWSLVPTIEKTGWDCDDRFVSGCEVSAESASSEMPIFSWITAPLPTLWENGKSLSKGWGRISSDEAKSSYPAGSGRQNPQAVRIVGFAAADRNGSKVVLEVADEITAIKEGIEWLCHHLDDKALWIHDVPGAKSLAVFRASLYNAILPSWFLFDRRGWLKDLHRVEEDGFSLIDFTNACGITQSSDDQLLPPMYNGQAPDSFSDKCRGWLYAASKFISSTQATYL